MALSYEKNHPNRSLSWRWDRILYLTSSYPPKRCGRRDDAAVKKARAFLVNYKSSEDETQRHILFRKHPDLMYAYEFYESHATNPYDGFRVQLEARLLTGQSDEEIAELVCTTPGAINWYEKLFFNVRDRLQSKDWILYKVLLPAADAAWEGNDKPLTTRLFAYFGGPVLLDFVSSGFRSLEHAKNPDECVELITKSVSDGLKIRSAQNVGIFEVNKFMMFDLVNAHARILEIERTTDDREKARNEIEKNIRCLLDELPFSTGVDAAELVKGTAIEEFDHLAVEPRDDDVLKLSVGERPEHLEKLKTLTIPEPRVKEDNGNPEQGS